MKLSILLFTLLITKQVFSSEIQLTTQHIQLKKQNLTGWQHDMLFKSSLAKNIDLGIVGSYVERFSIYENVYGAFFTYRLNDHISVEARYTQGIGNLLLPERESQMTAYFAVAPGFAPFLTLKNTEYSDTQIQSAALGVEIEKFANLILIPQLMLGKSKFKINISNEEVYSFGLKSIYYKENIFSAFIFAYKGLEASQGIIGSSNLRIHTTTGGIGGSYNVTSQFKAELTIDHTDYKELHDQFVTSTLNVNYKF